MLVVGCGARRPRASLPSRRSRGVGYAPAPSWAPASTSFFFQAEDGIRDVAVTGVQTCALPISDAVEADHLLAIGAAAGQRRAQLHLERARLERLARGAAVERPAALDRRARLLLRSEERREGKSVDSGGRGTGNDKAHRCGDETH